MKDALLKQLANASKTETHELVLSCMDYFHVGSTRELTEKQLREVNVNIMVNVNIIKRLNELEQVMRQNELDAMETCIEEGYPSNGSNYELRVATWNAEPQKEVAEIMETIDDSVIYKDGVWSIREAM